MARLRQCKAILYVTHICNGNKKVLAAKSFSTLAKLLLARSNVFENICEARLLQPITAFGEAYNF